MPCPHSSLLKIHRRAQIFAFLPVERMGHIALPGFQSDHHRNPISRSRLCQYQLFLPTWFPGLPVHPIQNKILT